MVGLLPIASAAVVQRRSPSPRRRGFVEQLQYMVKQDPALERSIVQGVRPGPDGREERRWLVALPSRQQLERVLRYMFDEDEFLSPHGIRSLSKVHQERPYVFEAEGQLTASPSTADDTTASPDSWPPKASSRTPSTCADTATRPVRRVLGRPV